MKKYRIKLVMESVRNPITYYPQRRKWGIWHTIKVGSSDMPTAFQSYDAVIAFLDAVSAAEDPLVTYLRYPHRPEYR